MSGPGQAPGIRAELAAARAAGVGRRDAECLLAHVLGKTRAWLIAHDDAVLGAAPQTAYRRLIARHAEGEPLAYLVGEQEFHGLRLYVDARVLVPRPDTEVLVDWAIELLRGSPAARPRPAVIDLGTGSGAIALAVKHAHPSAEVLATDASPDALAVARANARRLGLELGFAEAAWWQGVGGRRFDLGLSNPPYIAEGDAHLAALRHEPPAALVAGGDGLDDLRRLVQDAPPHLAPDAWLLLEHGFDQADAVRGLLARRGFVEVATRRDLAGHERCSAGRWTGAA